MNTGWNFFACYIDTSLIDEHARWHIFSLTFLDGNFMPLLGIVHVVKNSWIKEKNRTRRCRVMIILQDFSFWISCWRLPFSLRSNPGNVQLSMQIAPNFPEKMLCTRLIYCSRRSLKVMYDNNIIAIKDWNVYEFCLFIYVSWYWFFPFYFHHHSAFFVVSIWFLVYTFF